MNKVIIMGHLGRDPSVKFLDGGKAVCNFSVATNSGFGDKKVTQWHNVVAWNKTAEVCGKHLSKGSQVMVEGEIQYRKYKVKDGSEKSSTDIIARHVEFVGTPVAKKQESDDPHSYGPPPMEPEEEKLPF